MRAVLQRVTKASVSVAGQVVGEIDSGLANAGGLVVLVGVTHSDGSADVTWLASKLAELRIFEGERSAREVGAPVLVISQFTLYADTRKGRRPSWSAAAPGLVAEPLVNELVAALRQLGLTAATGNFGAHMHVSLVNDGPVTILLDSADRPGGAR
ncbi:MAG: D-tyrosyl-tRNA(Tyr) deacylase [Dermatophilaceae bacterium]|jgi:D-tyrosyl-tRNA(Tyr) deacylase|nr:D-tyrosyl-tRNA(Tyr) deacylase [Actinomycetales bacterium]MBP8880340.1 D-tyrosyl-tRNA(Tyr) deacylase [Dermatophilaceae bacterium]MBP9917228.1 D-tyrosyl-tRNA(Tyr) deacylase [Dermatophilaceae bacterium]